MAQCDTEAKTGIGVRSPLKIHASCAITVFIISKHPKVSSLEVAVFENYLTRMS